MSGKRQCAVRTVGEDESVSGMKRVGDPSAEMRWLADRPPEEATTGYDPAGWPASTWVLHAMYENPDLVGFGTHDDLHRRRLESGDVGPVIIGDVDLDSVGTVTGTSLGFVVHPGRPWRRITWEQYLARFPDFTGNREYPPCHRWFPPGSWPVAVEPPPEGSLDAESLDALTAVLTAQSPEGSDTRCFAFYASLPAGDFDTVHLWEGPLGQVQDLISDNGGPYDFSPTNVWCVDHGWFIWTDYDLQATKVSGDRSFIDALVSSPHLECISWVPRP
jgi:hypothetical protein